MVFGEIAEKASAISHPKSGILTVEVTHMKHLFFLGALGYPMLELAWRKRTHYSMSVAGGMSMLLIGRIRKLPLSFPARTLLCGLGITGVECMCGRIWNRRYQVWDYRRMPLNYRGQLCLPYALVWCGLGATMMLLLDAFEHQKQPGS